MGEEIERKFLVRSSEWPRENGVALRQGYLNSAKERIVRVRVAGEEAKITFKGITERGVRRREFEYDIPLDDANEMLDILAEPHIVEKTRYTVMFGGLAWEIDEFTGVNAGLVIAEVTLQDEHQAFEKPEWVGKEVSGDYRYYSSNLAKEPYTTWR